MKAILVEGGEGEGRMVKYLFLVFLKGRGKVKVERVKDVTAETILRETIKKVRKGSLIYTDRFRSYEPLVMYGFRHERIEHGDRFASGRVHINGIEGFWSYAKERLLSTVD